MMLTILGYFVCEVLRQRDAPVTIPTECTPAPHACVSRPGTPCSRRGGYGDAGNGGSWLAAVSCAVQSEGVEREGLPDGRPHMGRKLLDPGSSERSEFCGVVVCIARKVVG